MAGDGEGEGGPKAGTGEGQDGPTAGTGDGEGGPAAATRDAVARTLRSRASPTTPPTAPPHVPLDEPVGRHARRAFVALGADLTVDQALAAMRDRGVAQGIFYVYVTGQDDRLVGVIPVRQFLTAPVDTRLADLMTRDVVTLAEDARVLDAMERFLDHRLLAFPVVDGEGRMVGVVDVDLFAREVVDYAEQQARDDVFRWIGYRVSEVRDASVLAAARSRFTWLLATVAGGTGAALIAGLHAATLAEAIILAVFLTLVLGLAESVSIQSMSLTLQRLHFEAAGARSARQGLAREVPTAVLIGGGVGALVGAIAWAWRGDPVAAGVIGASILLAVTAASLVGLLVPTVLSATGKDLKIAAGPVTLATTDVLTLAIYLGLGAWLLGP